MLHQIKGLHHVTSLASSASENNRFFTKVLGLRRVKKTVNFDAPDVYHLYYGDMLGRPGTVMTYFPFPNAKRGRPGIGEVGRTAFAVPKGSLPDWADRLEANAVAGIKQETRLGEERLTFFGPDGDAFALVASKDHRAPCDGGGIPAKMAIRGFHSVELRLADAAPETELLNFMGYEKQATEGRISRYSLSGGNGATLVDVCVTAEATPALQGAGSVHHIAFSVENRARQLEVREALVDSGYKVTAVRDRQYFHAIYFRTPGGILFEVATDEPGFATDENLEELGRGLKLPGRHEHLRSKLLRTLEPIEA